MKRIRVSIAAVSLGLCFFAGGCGRAQTAETTAVISFMATGLGDNALNNAHSDEVTRQYEEHTGISVEWQWFPTETYAEHLNYALMDKANIPMIVTVGSNMKEDIINEAKKGSFWDLDPFLERKDLFPNLSQANQNILNAMRIDGKLIGIYRSRAVGRYGLSYREDWAQAVGIAREPETIEEVYDMLYRFTYNDPDGNGVDDTYGLEMTNYVGSIDIIQTWFGCGNGWVERGGELIPVHETEEYMEALQWLRKVYQDGLMRPDWPLVDSTAFGSAIKNGEAGVIVDVMVYGAQAWNFCEEHQIPSAANASQTASMRLVGPIEGATLSTDGYNGFFVITTDGAKTEEDVINCLTFLDRMCDEEMLLLADYGLEGITYRINGEGRVEDISGIPTEQSPEYGLNQAICYIPNTTISQDRIPRTEIAQAQKEAYARNEAVAVYNPAIGYLANSEVNAAKGSQLDELLEKARTEYICAQITKEEFRQRIRQWEISGGEELKREINLLYQKETAEEGK